MLPESIETLVGELSSKRALPDEIAKQLLDKSNEIYSKIASSANFRYLKPTGTMATAVLVASRELAIPIEIAELALLTFTTKESLFHGMSAFKNAKSINAFACPHCKRAFKNYGAGQNHVNWCAQNPGNQKNQPKIADIPCPHCSRLFANAGTMKSHAKACQKKHQLTTYKQICDTYDNLRETKNTEKNSTPKREKLPILYQKQSHNCPHCNKFFANGGAMKSHAKACGKPSKKERRQIIDRHCPHCSRLFANAGTMKSHAKACQKRVPKPLLPFDCEGERVRTIRICLTRDTAWPLPQLVPATQEVVPLLPAVIATPKNVVPDSPDLSVRDKLIDAQKCPQEREEQPNSREDTEVQEEPSKLDIPAKKDSEITTRQETRHAGKITKVPPFTAIVNCDIGEITPEIFTTLVKKYGQDTLNEMSKLPTAPQAKFVQKREINARNLHNAVQKIRDAGKKLKFPGDATALVEHLFLKHTNLSNFSKMDIAATLSYVSSIYCTSNQYEISREMDAFLIGTYYQRKFKEDIETSRITEDVLRHVLVTIHKYDEEISDLASYILSLACVRLKYIPIKYLYHYYAALAYLSSGDTKNETHKEFANCDIVTLNSFVTELLSCIANTKEVKNIVGAKQDFYLNTKTKPIENPRGNGSFNKASHAHTKSAQRFQRRMDTIGHD